MPLVLITIPVGWGSTKCSWVARWWWWWVVKGWVHVAL